MYDRVRLTLSVRLNRLEDREKEAMLPPEKKNRSDFLDSRQVDAVDVLVWEVYLPTAVVYFCCKPVFRGVITSISNIINFTSII